MITLGKLLSLIANKNDKVIINELQEDKKNKVVTLQNKMPIKQAIQNFSEQLLTREVLSIDAKININPLEGGVIFTIVVK